MFTGSYNSQSERIENVIINFSLFVFALFVTAKITSVGTLTWLQVAMPLIIPVVGFFAFVLGMYLIIGTTKVIIRGLYEIQNVMKYLVNVLSR